MSKKRERRLKEKTESRSQYARGPSSQSHGTYQGREEIKEQLKPQFSLLSLFLYGISIMALDHSPFFREILGK
jgi:hypothetical protein